MTLEKPWSRGAAVFVTWRPLNIASADPRELAMPPLLAPRSISQCAQAYARMAAPVVR